MELDFLHQVTRVLAMTLPEYERLRARSRRKFDGRWYNVYSYTPLGTFFHRVPKIVVKLILTPNGSSDGEGA